MATIFAQEQGPAEKDARTLESGTDIADESIEKGSKILTDIRLSTLNWANIVAFVAYMITIGAVLPSSAGLSTPVTYPNFFDVPGWAFASWGPIYLFEGCFCVYQMFPSVRATKLVTDGVGYWYVLQALTGILWTLCTLAPQAPPVGIITILIMWSSNLILVISVYRHRLREINSGMAAQLSFSEATKHYWLLYSGFSFNLAWLTAASFVNIAFGVGVYESLANVIGFTIAALVTIGIAAFTAGVVLIPGDPAICGMLAWATGSVAANMQHPESYITKYIPDPAMVEGFVGGFAFISVICLIFMVCGMATTIWIQLYGRRFPAAFEILRSDSYSAKTAS